MQVLGDRAIADMALKPTLRNNFYVPSQLLPRLTPRRLVVRFVEEWRWLAAASYHQRVQRLKRFGGLLATIPLAFALHLGLRLLDLVCHVRIGTLNAKGRISIMISYIEPYVRQLRLDGLRNPLVIVINPGTCPNEQLTRMYRRAVWLLDDHHPWLRQLFMVAHRFFSSRSRLRVPLRSGVTYEFARAWQEGNPALHFSEEEHRVGQSLLRSLGVPQEASYICFGLRDAAYYQQFLAPGARGRNLNTEAREDTYIRNPPLQRYLQMAIQCAERGLYVLRMGQVVGESLPRSLPPRVIDYAWNARTPFGDIYLLATCKFVVAAATGLWWVPAAFNRPVVITDSYYLPLRGLREGDLLIPHLLWFQSEKRFLTFKEMLSTGMRYSYERNCRCDGIEVIHNTRDEISAVVQEMDQRLNGTWQSSEEDEELQRRFNALYTPVHMGFRMPGRIGAVFLHTYAALL